MKKKNPTDGNNEIIVPQNNNISQLSNLFFFKGKNSDIFGHNPKMQTNRQQKYLNRSAFATLPYRLCQIPIDSDPTKTCPVDFKFKNPPARESRNNTIQVHQMTKVLNPHLIESHDQTSRAFRVNNVNSNNPEQMLPKTFE